MSSFEERAARRRSKMVGGVARSFAELEEAGQRFWEAASMQDKLQATHAMLFEAWVLQGRNGPPPRFDGSTWGVLEHER
jgi:hypothetical protein